MDCEHDYETSAFRTYHDHTRYIKFCIWCGNIERFWTEYKDNIGQ